jgi:alpha-galactosidase
MKTVHIAIIGAGSSQFSGGIIRDICVTPNLSNSILTLMDIDEKRLRFIADMGRKLVKELNGQIQIRTTISREEALQGAEFVINTAQDKGHPWANEQMDIARRHGYADCGVLMMTSQVAFLVDVAKDMERICPDAILIQSSNPVFEGCTMIHRLTNIKCIGLCHGHYGYREIADVLGLDRKDVTAKMHGFNHWIFMTDFRYKGEDAYPLIDKWIEEEAEEYWKKERKYSDQQMSRAAIHEYRMFGLMPIGDTVRMMDWPSMYGWVYNESLEAKKYYYSQQGGFDSEEGWGDYLADLEENLKKIEVAAENDAYMVSDIFKPEQSDEQIVPIIESLVFDVPRVYQVNIPNAGGLVPGFPEDIVVETEALISGAGIRGIANAPFPHRVQAGAMNPRYTQCELMVEALLSGDREAFEMLFLPDHYTKSLETLDEMLDEWINHPKNEYLRKMIHTKHMDFGREK